MREKDQCVAQLIYTFTGCLLYELWGLNPQPWHIGMMLKLYRADISFF